jgi:hypothetical protein
MSRFHLLLIRDRLSRLSTGSFAAVFTGLSNPSYLQHGVHTLAGGQTVALPACRGTVQAHATNLAPKPLRIPKTSWQEGETVPSSDAEGSPANLEVDEDRDVAQGRSYFSELLIR